MEGDRTGIGRKRKARRYGSQGRALSAQGVSIRRLVSRRRLGQPEEKIAQRRGGGKGKTPATATHTPNGLFVRVSTKGSYRRRRFRRSLLLAAGDRQTIEIASVLLKALHDELTTSVCPAFCREVGEKHARRAEKGEAREKRRN